MRLLRLAIVAALVVGATVAVLAAVGGGGSERTGSDDRVAGATTTTVTSTTTTTIPVRCPFGDSFERIDDPGPLALGLATNFVWDEHADVEGEMAVLAACGVTAIREDLLWEVIEPERGRHAWARTDRVLRAAAAHGVGVLGILGYSAPWASTDPSGEAQRNHPPSDVAAFADYAAAVAQRYGPSSPFWEGSPDGFRPLAGLEIWNEAWGWWAWRPDPDPVAYAQLALAAATAIDEAASDVAVVLTADPFQNRRGGGHPPWFDAVLEASPSLPPLIDAYAVHPYPGPREAGPLQAGADPWDDFGRVALVDEVARARGVVRPIWITEVGWSTSAASHTVSETDQAGHLTAAIQRAKDQWPFVERLFVYTWARDREDQSDIESGFGLRRIDGSAKPALLDLLRLAAELAAAS